MAANDPISKVVACQFTIDYSLFDFEIDTNFNPPNLPGLGNLMFSFFQAIIETLLFFLKPLNYILEGKIPDLLDWIATATTDPIQFAIDGINLVVLGPYTNNLKVSTPNFTVQDLPLIGELPIPAINPGLPGYDNNPQWLGQIQGFISLFTGLIKLPIELFVKIFTFLIEKLKFPPVGKPLFDELWEGIVPALGLPSIEAIECVTRLGGCFAEQIEDIIPGAIPKEGAGRTTPPPSFAVFVEGGPTPVTIQDSDSYFFEGIVDTKTLHIQWTGTNYTIESIYVQNGVETPVNYFSCTSGSFTLNSSNQNFYFPLSLNVAGKLPVNNATIVIKVTSPTEDAFTFQIVSYKDNLFDTLRKEIRAMVPYYPGALDKKKWGVSPSGDGTYLQAHFDANIELFKSIYDTDTWDPHLNIFGIRKDDESAVDQFEDIIGMAYYNTDNLKWYIYAFKATTRPTAFYRSAELNNTNKNPKGVDTVLSGFYPSMWRPGQHPIGPIPNCFVMDYNSPPIQYCKIWRDTDGNGKKDNKDPAFLANISFNSHRTIAYYLESGTPPSMGQASAGCQVLQDRRLFDQVFSLLCTSKKNKIRIPNRYAYSLFLKVNVPALWDLLDPYENSWPDGLVGVFEDF